MVYVLSMTIDKFMGGTYDPSGTPRFEEDGRVILLPAGFGATFILPSHYTQFIAEAGYSGLLKLHSGGPAFYVINLDLSQTISVKDVDANTLFTVAPDSVREVYAGDTLYYTVEHDLNSTGRTATAEVGRPAVTSPTPEDIPSDNVCDEPTFKLTPCAAGSAKYVQDEDLWSSLIGDAVFIGGLWYLVSQIDVLPEGESIEDIAEGIEDSLSRCPTCSFGPGEQFNGYIGDPLNKWTRLRPIASGAGPNWFAHATCYELWIYEDVHWTASAYVLSGASVVTALRTPGGETALLMLNGSVRHAYMPMFDMWDYFNRRGPAGSPGTERTVYPYKWDQVGGVGGSINGYSIDIDNPSWTFDATQLALIYDTMIADYDGSPDVAPGDSVSHTLILYLRLHSQSPRNKDNQPTSEWDSSSFRNGWEANTVYAIGDEIRPGCTGTIAVPAHDVPQFPTSDFAFRCTARAGDFMSGSGEPTWSGPIGNVVDDDTNITWTATSRNHLANPTIYCLAAHATCNPA